MKTPQQTSARDTAKYFEGMLIGMSVNGQTIPPRFESHINNAIEWLYRVSFQEHICRHGHFGCKNGESCNTLH